MRRVWLLLGVVILLIGTAIAAPPQPIGGSQENAPTTSQPPSPSGGKPSNPNEGQPASSNHGASHDERGTEQIPLVVKIIPAPKNQAEINEEKYRADEHAANERGLTNATWVLAGFTLLLAMVASGQIGLFFWQLRLMREGVNDARDAAKAAQTSADATLLHARAAIASEISEIVLVGINMVPYPDAAPGMPDHVIPPAPSRQMSTKCDLLSRSEIPAERG